MDAAELMVRARRALASAQKLLQDNDGDGACNRVYYAMFDAARAALITSNAPGHQKLPKPIASCFPHFHFTW